MIRVFVADSSAVVRSVLKEIILKTSKLEWAGEAASYESLKSSVASSGADVIITDKNLFDSIRTSTFSDFCHTTLVPAIMYYPAGDKPEISAKNVRFIEMPQFMNFSSQKISEYSSYLEQLILDIKCSVLFENHSSITSASISEDGTFTHGLKTLSKEFAHRSFKAVLVGVSTGGPGALLEFLKGIGKNYPLPIIITQHIDSFFDKNLIKWLGTEASVPIQLAENNIPVLAGHVYFAPSDVHITFSLFSDSEVRILLNHDAPVNFLRPSVDKMFASAAKVFGANCIAVILTGMGADGAKECLHLKQLGAYTITQDEATSVIYGMPKAAYEMGGACEVLPLNQIPERLWTLAGKERA